MDKLRRQLIARLLQAAAGAGALRGARRPLALAGLFAVACSATGDAREGSSLDEPRTIVDSIFPVEEEIRRFRSTLWEAPEQLAGGERSRDALVERFLRAVEVADTLAFREMLMTAGEFGYLYYPFTTYTAAPYRLSPALLWFQLENSSSRGFHRLMQRLGGQRLPMAGYRCEDEPRVEEENRLWSDCLVLLQEPGGEAYALRLFGSILERDGRFKFVSYANDF